MSTLNFLLNYPHLPHQIACIQFLADAGFLLVVEDQLVAGELDFDAVVEYGAGVGGFEFAEGLVVGVGRTGGLGRVFEGAIGRVQLRLGSPREPLAIVKAWITNLGC